MKIRYILTMEDAVVHGEPISRLTIDWEDERSREEIMGHSQRWITTEDYLTTHMNGLNEVGESSLTIEPVENDVLSFD